MTSNKSLACLKKRPVRRVLSAIAAFSVFMTSMPISVYALDYGNATPVTGGITGGTVGNTTTINQTGQAGIINWTTFDMAAGETANFVQPNTSAVTLNRITADMNGTQIAGQINANGSVWVVDPNGVFIQEGASVNVGAAFMAAAMNISDADFLSGKMNFSDVKGVGTVENKGSISAGTMAALLGGSVYNEGSIQAAQAVLAAAGKSIVLDEVGRGTITLMLDNEDQVSSEPATVLNKGLIDVSGGSVLMEGTRVGQFGTIHADGQTDGGTIKLMASDAVVLSSDSITTANAGLAGDGGNIWIVGEKTARIGTGADIQARGGSLSGDGGFVETSGYQSFEIGAAPDVGAPAGTGGTWLIDPSNIDIVAGGGAVNITAADPFVSFADNAQLDVTLILTALNSGAVTIQTGAGTQAGNITVSTAVNYSSKTFGLTLDAANNIIFDANVIGGLNDLTLIAGGAVSQNLGTSVSAANLILTVTGDVTLNQAGNDFTSVSGAAASLTLTDATAINLGIVTATGDLTVNAGANAITQSGVITVAGTTDLTGGDIILDNVLNDFQGVVNAYGNNVGLLAANSLLLGNVTASGNIWLQAIGGDVTVGIINALGGVWIAASGNIIDADIDPVTVTANGIASGGTVNITADRLAMTAGGNIGNDPGTVGTRSFNAIDTRVNTVAAVGNNVAIANKGDLTLGPVSVTVTPTLTGTLDGIRASAVGGKVNLLAEGSIIDGNGGLRNITCGTLVIAGATSIGGNGAGGLDPLEINLTGGSPFDIWINNAGGGTPLYAAFTTDGGISRPVMQAAYGSMAFGVVNGKPGGDQSFLDAYDMDAMFGKDTPELKSRQGVFGSPFFLHDQMDVNSPVALGFIDFLLAGKAYIVGDPDLIIDPTELMEASSLSPKTSIWFKKEKKDVNPPAVNGEQEKDAQPKANQVTMR